MESEDDNGRPLNKVVRSVRNSYLFSSLPSYNRLRKTESTSMENICKRKNKLFNKTTERSSSLDGITNALSTDSIKNACGFCEDECSNNDLIEIHTLSQPRIRIKHLTKGPLQSENCNEDITSVTEEEKCSKTNKKATFNTNLLSSNFNETESALKEFNNMDEHAAICANTSISIGTEIETKIEDCLLDLDNYLEKLDNSSPVHLDNEVIHSTNQLLGKHTFPYRKNNYLLPTNMGNSNCEFDRNHDVRKTVSCAFDKRYSGSSTETSQTFTNIGLMNKRHRSSMCKTAFIKFPEILLRNENKNDATSFKIESSISANAESVQNLSQDWNHSGKRKLSSSSFLPLPSDDGKSLCENVIQTSRNEPNEVLTQESIFNSLLSQNENIESLEYRPRQFGRRVEGYPQVVSLQNENNTCTIVNHNQRPMSAPALNEYEGTQANQCSVSIGSNASSTRTSRTSPISVISISDSNSTINTTSGTVEINHVMNGSVLHQCGSSDLVNTQLGPHNGFNSEWPHKFSRTLALACCTFGLFNVSRFAILTVHYGGNFLLQFMLLSVMFGIPLFWLQICLGAKIKSGPVSMWKISPICRGIGISLVIVQCFIAIYSTIAITWLLVYLRDSFPTENHQHSYRWQEPLYSHHQTTTTSVNLTECLADYFNIILLQRSRFIKQATNNDIRFRVNEQLAFSLAILWTAVFLILCKGLKSFGKVIYVQSLLTFIALVAITCKFLHIIEPSKLQNIFKSTSFDDFLINSKTWSAASQETFLTWGLLGTSVISVTSRSHTSRNVKIALRKDAILAVFITIVGLCIAGLLGLCCVEVLNQHTYIYVPGSFEKPESYFAVYHINASLNTNLISYPSKLVPHYSSFVGETYRRPTIVLHQDSGYQALRFITELFPAVVALSRNSFSWIWTSITFITFTMLGLGQLCVMWKPISTAIGNSTSSVLLSCVTGLLLSIPLSMEMGISVLHYMDMILGGSWFIPILWTAQIFGVFLIRGRPYNGDDLVNDLNMSGSISAFLALSWNVLLPIGLLTLAVIEYKISISYEFYNWRGKSYFNYWARKIAGVTQISLLLLIPITAMVQIYRYLSRGPPDILDRIQLLYRPSENTSNNTGNAYIERNRNENSEPRTHGNNGEYDAPPKYTPPPSYTTATGARLAKILRQSIRRSIGRILREPGREHHNQIVADISSQSFPPDCLTTRTVLENTDSTRRSRVDPAVTSQPISCTTYAHRSLSLGRTIFKRNRSNLRSLRYLRQPYTAEDVITVLRASTKESRQIRTLQRQEELQDMRPEISIRFRSIDNLIQNIEPPDHSRSIDEIIRNEYETNNQ